MILQYNIILFEPERKNYVTKDELEQFLEDAEFVLSHNMAWHKDFIKEVSIANRGAILEFNDGLMTHGYNVISKFIKIK